jgi:hypothetical protein
MNVFVILFLAIIVVYVNGQTSSFSDCKSNPLSTFPICNQALPTQWQEMIVFLHILHRQNLCSLIIIASDGSKCLEPGLYHLLFEKKHECIQLSYKENRDVVVVIKDFVCISI